MSNNNNDDFLVSEAARPGLWLKERFTPSAWTRMLAESDMFGPEGYRKRMDLLRKHDDQVEEKIGRLDSLLGRVLTIRKTKGALGAAHLAELGLTLIGINSMLKFPLIKRKEILGETGAMTEDDLNEWSSQVSYDFDFFDEAGSRAFHEEIRSKKDDGKTAEAGFLGDLVRYFIRNKLQTPEMIKRDKALRRVIDKANVAVKRFHAERENMANARAGGDIGAYMKSLDKMAEIQDKFENGSSENDEGGFKKIYEKYLFKPVDFTFKKKEEEGDDTPVTLNKEDVQEAEQVATEEGEPTSEGEAPEEGEPEPEPEPELSMEEIRVAIENVEDPELKAQLEDMLMKGRMDELTPLVQEELAKMGPEMDTSHEGKEHVIPMEYPATQEEGGDKYQVPPVQLDPEAREQMEKAHQRGFETHPVHAPPPTHMTVTPSPEWTANYPGVEQPPMPEGPVESHKSEERERSRARREKARLEKEQMQPTESSLEMALTKMGHARFMDELNKVASTGNTGLMIAMLAKYSEMIEKKDPKGSMKLLAIAEGILNG